MIEIIGKNSKNNIQTLQEHSFKVFEEIDLNQINLHLLFKYFKDLDFSFKNKEDCQDQIILFFKILSFLHDLGKVYPEFQKILNSNKNLDEQEEKLLKKDEDKWFSHTKLSYLISHFIQSNKLNCDLFPLLQYCILYHHGKYLFEKDYEKNNCFTYLPKDFEEHGYKQEIVNYLENVNRIYDLDLNYNFSNRTLKNLSNLTYQSFKYQTKINFKEIKEEAIKTLLRIIFNNSDRMASRDFNLNDHPLFLNKILNFSSQNFLNNFNQKFDLANNLRTQLQNEIEDSLLQRFKKYNLLILDGAPGCGKTKIFCNLFNKLNLENNVKQMFIVTPRNTIADSLYKEFQNEEYFSKEVGNISFEILNSEKSEKTVFIDGKKEIISLNDIREKYLSNIVLISIDHLIKLYNDIHNQHIFYSILNSFVVFDEFHEIYELTLPQIYFIEMLHLFCLFKNSKVLLVSGTINKTITTRYIELQEEQILKLDSFNDKPIKISFLNQEEMKNKQDELKNFISIYNTAIKSQIETISYISRNNEISNIYNFHSLFNKEDKQNLLTKILKNFNKKSIEENKILFSGPIAQASLNITRNHLFTEYSNAENIIQRIGRLNRFGNYEIGFLYLFETESYKISKFDTIKQKLQNIFIDYIKNNTTNFDLLNMNDFRKIYMNFEDFLIRNYCKEDMYDKNELVDDLIECIFEDSFNLLEKIRKTPIKYNFKNKDKKLDLEENIRINDYGLRGESGIRTIPFFVELNTKEELEELKEELKNEKIIGKYLTLKETIVLNKEKLKDFKIKEILNTKSEYFNQKFNNTFYSELKEKWNELFQENNQKTKKQSNKTKFLLKKYSNELDQLKFCSNYTPIPLFFDNEIEQKYIYLNYRNIKIGLIDLKNTSLKKDI